MSAAKLTDTATQQPAATMSTATRDKYRVVSRPKTPIQDDEIRIASDGRLPRYVAYAARLFVDQGRKSVTIKATGNAIPLAISLAEIMKRRLPNLHQVSTIGDTTISEVYEPVEEGLEGQVHERDVPFIEIVLTVEVDSVNTSAIGYQKPIDQSLVKTMAVEDLVATRSRGGRGGYRSAGRRPVDSRRGRGGYRRGPSAGAPNGNDQDDAPTNPSGGAGRRRGGYSRGGYGRPAGGRGRPQPSPQQPPQQ